MDDSVHQNIKNIFAKRDIPLLDTNRDQALVPDRCTVIPNSRGTAPGMLFEENNIIYVSMPGVPFEMKAMMRNTVLPYLSTLNINFNIVHQTITVVNIPESIIADRIKDVEADLPRYLKIAYLPHLNLVRIRITGRSVDHSSEKMQNEIEAYFDRIKYKLDGHYFNGERSLAEIVGEMLVESGLQLGTVESCSGGFIAHSITKNPGSSAYFRGGMVTYSNELKTEKLGVPVHDLMTVGAVSEEVARQMAKSAQQQLKVDYCISTTGIAGPTGATDVKPVGLVYIGIARPNGEIDVFKNIFRGTRTQVIERTANTALELVRTMIRAEILNSTQSS